ncbi:MAG: hypothetical protein K0R62_6418, partial [Nonomuraea muscovyensis]|nr:hypothetical protein [Nonomuraea muscovyensis]
DHMINASKSSIHETTFLASDDSNARTSITRQYLSEPSMLGQNDGTGPSLR